jgi:ATP-binding cassette, subfamily B, bacterial
VTFVRGFATILAGSWRASPGRMTLSFVVLFLNYVSWPLAPLALKEVTDAVVAGNARRAVIAAAFLPLITALQYAGDRVAHTVWVELSDLNVMRMAGELGELAQGPPGLEHHERADYADLIELMRNEGWELYGAVRLAMTAISLAVQFAVTVALLTLVEPVLLLLLLFAVPPVLADRWAWRRWDRARTETADRSRLATHLFDLAVRQDAAKEIRLFGLQAELRGRLAETRRELRRRLARAEALGVVAISAGQLVFSLGFVAALVLVVRRAVGGSASIGDVVLVVTLATRINGLLFQVVAVAVWLQRSVQAMGRLVWLRGLVDELYGAGTHDARPPETLREGLRFDGVRFRYPGTEADVLRDVDLELPAGTTVALVGENGAGKSTLVKLLCGFYSPTEGRVLADGADLARFPHGEWRARIAAGFQDFVRFELLARESVGVGDLPALDDPAAVLAAVERADARDLLEGLPSGLDTQLGKSYTNGAELSGGQWQKVALARAMMRAAPLLLILDEPTSALDAHAEHVLFERYAASARSVARATGGVAVFVSHRFSTVRMADRIVVVDDGRIAEQGTHEELVALGGVYAELFALQAAAYE